MIKDETNNIQVPLNGACLSLEIDSDQRGATRKIPVISATRLSSAVNLPVSHSESKWAITECPVAELFLACGFGRRAKLSAAILCRIFEAERPIIVANAMLAKRIIVDVITTTESVRFEELVEVETQASKANKADSDPAPILKARRGDLLGIFDTSLDDFVRSVHRRTRQAQNNDTPLRDGE